MRPARPPVAYQGEPGAYGEEAALGYFGEGMVVPLPLPTFSAVCAAVLEGRAAAAVLPLENSLAGAVGEAVDALMRADLAVTGELLLPVRHQLLGLPGVALEDVEHVASHRQALAQCEAFLSSRSWRLIVAEDTAGAARQLVEAGDHRAAVIASERAAARYGLAILAGDIQDTPGNMTRFAVITRPAAAPAVPQAIGALAVGAHGPLASLVVFETRHTAGALHHALGALAEAGVNMSRIESRPTGRVRWEYRFLVSVEGHSDVEPLRGALAELGRRAHAVRVLGSFPSAG
jgi:prephenate dehydratase